MNFDRILDNLNSLTVYKNIAKDKIVELLKDVLTAEDNYEPMAKLVTMLMEEAEKNGFSGNLFRNYIIHLLLSDENTFTLYCENNVAVAGTSIYRMAQDDINTVLSIANINLHELPDSHFLARAIDEVLSYVPVSSPKSDKRSKSYGELTIDDIIAFHNKAGCGDISNYRSFRYDDDTRSLKGIAHPDPITFDDLIGYEAQTKQLIDNTEAFIHGFNANNVLLVGARGTGKSSSVKALVNRYFDEGLRILEITKEQIAELPDILKLIRPRGRYFIIFIDDLSFDEGEIQYKYMKSLLEGGAEGKPDNVLFYATSNRRHLIQEKWSDRSSGSEDAEIHTTDTLNEKLSLADRFGITITYPKPTPKEYINIVSGIAKRRGLDVDEATLKQEALKWELNQKGMSGRTAKQFINNMLWQAGSNSQA
jgi:predicted AAA+ superfamily ATPase